MTGMDYIAMIVGYAVMSMSIACVLISMFAFCADWLTRKLLTETRVYYLLELGFQTDRERKKQAEKMKKETEVRNGD